MSTNWLAKHNKNRGLWETQICVQLYIWGMKKIQAIRRSESRFNGFCLKKKKININDTEEWWQRNRESNLLWHGVAGFLLDLRSDVCLVKESVSSAAMIWVLRKRNYQLHTHRLTVTLTDTHTLAFTHAIRSTCTNDTKRIIKALRLLLDTLLLLLLLLTNNNNTNNNNTNNNVDNSSRNCLFKNS